MASLAAGCQSTQSPPPTNVPAITQQAPTKTAPETESRDTDARQIVETAVKQGNELLDLSRLRTYEHITAVDLAPLESQKAIKHIRILDASELNLSDVDLMPIKNLKLQELNLTKNRCDDLAALATMQTLQNLTLAMVPLNAKGFERISNLSNLETLSLNHTGLTDATLHYLSPLKKLKSLSLEGNHLSYDHLLKFKKQLPHCHFNCGFSKTEDSKEITGIKTSIKDKAYADTAKTLEEQLKLWKEQKPQDKSSMEKGYALLGQCLAQTGRKKEAEAMFKKGLELTFSCDTEHLSLWTGPAAQYLSYLAEEGRWDDTVRFRRLLEQKALTQRGTIASLNSAWMEERAKNYEFMGMALTQDKKFERAADAYNKAATLYQGADEPALDRAISCKLLAADDYKAAGNKIPAISSINDAKRIIPELIKVDEKLAAAKERELDEKLKQL